ncbi:MAG: M23 family metallopeptidase, partial [Burkholderiales bacterium]
LGPENEPGDRALVRAGIRQTGGGALAQALVSEIRADAAAAGVVVFAGRHPGYGNQVDIDHGNGLVTRYAHASRFDVAEGEIVRHGQKIAEVGSTGRSTGPHLHFEVRVDGVARDPLPYLRAGMRGPGTPPLARTR